MDTHKILLLSFLEVSVINQSIKFFSIFLLVFNVFAGGDDRDQEYYEVLDEELAAFEAQLAEDLANQAALETFHKKLSEEKAAAAAEAALDEQLAEFEAQLEAKLAEAAGAAAAAAEAARMQEIEEELANQAALEAFQQKLADEKAAAAASTAA